ncbi:MAG: TonB-dependent receptor [Rhodothermales bacterium]
MNRYKSLLFAALLALIGASPAQAQHQITGIVVDAATQEALPGVNVFATGTTLGATTDSDGRFTVRSTVNLTSLTFSYLGYKAQTIELGAETELRVALEPTTVDLQPVIVSAGRGVQARTDAPIAIDALSASKLQETKPTMLYQALNQIPGVHMTNLGNEQHTMSIRQPLQYKALFVYLEDGLPIRPTGVFNHNALIEINMAGIERVEVIRGPSSALYGSNAVGGAINFITPEPTDVFSGYFNARVDNYGYRRSDFNASTTFGKLGIYAGGYVARQRDSWADHTDFDKLSLTFRADYALAERTKWVTTLSTNHLDTDMRGDLDSLNFYGRGYSSLQTFTYRTVDATRVRSTVTQNWNDLNTSDLTVGFRQNSIGQLPSYRVRDDRTNPLRATGEINDNSFTSYLANLQHKAYFGTMDAVLTAGLSADFSPNSYYADFLEIQRNADGQYIGFTQLDSTLTNYDVDLLNTAAYAQFEIVPIDRLRLVASLRYDRIDYNYDNHLTASAFSGAPDEKNGYNSLSPKLGLTYDLRRGRGLYANWSQGFIPPEIGDLYRGVKVPTLQPANFDSYEAGGWAAFLQGKLYVNASLYRMDGRNEIISVRLDDGSTENRNAGKTRHTGVEYAVVYSPIQALSFRIGGTNAVHEFLRYEEAGVIYDGNEMNQAPGWIANAEVMFRPPFLKGSRIALEWQHLDRYYMDVANTFEYDGYNLLHLRMGYEIKGVEVWANVENLTDELYANIAARNRFGDSYSPGSARNIVFGVGYRFGRR